MRILLHYIFNVTNVKMFLVYFNIIYIHNFANQYKLIY